MNVDSLLETEVTRQLLKYAAGRQIFCPVCSSVLDWASTVIFNGHVTCCDCFREITDRALSDVPHDEAVSKLASYDIDCARSMYLSDDNRLSYGINLLCE